MRQFLLAALGAAGSLLMGLPALAQLSNTTSTFSGQVAASCSFSEPDDTALYFRFGRELRAYSVFNLFSNLSSVLINVGSFETLEEPVQNQSPAKHFVLMLDNGIIEPGEQLRFTTDPDPSVPNGLDMAVLVSSSNGDPLSAGRYSYRVRIDCLL